MTEEDMLGELQPGDLVMCRRNTPMLSLAKQRRRRACRRKCWGMTSSRR